MSDLKELPDRPAIPGRCEVRTEGGLVLLEPQEVHGVKGFTVYLTREAADNLGHRLIRAAVQLRQPTTKTG